MATHIFLLALFLCNMLLFWVSQFHSSILWYRWASFGIWIALLAIMPIVPQMSFHTPLVLAIIAWVFLAGSLFVVSWSALIFIKIGFDNKEVLPLLVAAHGPYKVIRHPQYAALFVFYIAWSVIWGAGLCLLTAPVVLFFHIYQAILEERYIMLPHFGPEFILYKKRVGMFLPKFNR